MSTAVDEFGQQLVSLRNSLSVERNSRKLYGYDFVNYRSDCETSNANGLLKYNDVVNFGRRISDASVHNCVMCGDFDVVIPTQNKDVCKGCDSAFWYNAKLNVTFKFCKGCKNFVTLEMFSDKPDASKCCRCRRRGRAWSRAERGLHPMPARVACEVVRGRARCTGRPHSAPVPARGC